MDSLSAYPIDPFSHRNKKASGRPRTTFNGTDEIHSADEANKGSIIPENLLGLKDKSIWEIHIMPNLNILLLILIEMGSEMGS